MPRKKDNITYESAMQEIKSIVSRLEAGEISLDQIIDEVERANFLIKFCQEKLNGLDMGIKKAFMDQKLGQNR